ncbi:hypothetical protein IAT40_007371 [Kwoniella sp. CBS 6097]
MKVLLLGSTGNVGSRLLSALLLHGHTPILYLRSTGNLPSRILASIPEDHIVLGSATDVGSIRDAIEKHDCDAVINAAGVASMFSKTKTFPAIFKAVATAAAEAGEARGNPIRAWFMSGWGLLDSPGTGSMIYDYLPIFPDHPPNYRLLQSTSASSLNWSALCAFQMYPAKPLDPTSPSSEDGLDLAREAQAHRQTVVGAADSPPKWTSTLAWIPFIGSYLNIMANTQRYGTTLEQLVEFIVSDLDQGVDSEYSRRRVGIIASK